MITWDCNMLMIMVFMMKMIILMMMMLMMLMMMMMVMTLMMVMMLMMAMMEILNIVLGLQGDTNQASVPGSIALQGCACFQIGHDDIHDEFHDDDQSVSALPLPFSRYIFQTRTLTKSDSAFYVSWHCVAHRVRIQFQCAELFVPFN